MTREMKDSGIQWIGKIPKDWLVLPVKSLYKFETGFTPPTEKNEFYCDDGEVWITISDLTKPIVYDSETKILKDYAKNKGSLHIKGSLLYSFKLSVGKKAILGCNAYTNEAIAVFDAQNNPCIPYLYYSIDLVEFNSNENIYGAKLLNRELINNSPIVFPPLTEQHRIASFLDTKCAEIDKAIEATKASIEEYIKLRQAIITEAVTKGLDPNVEMKDSGVEWIGEIPKSWNKRKLCWICSFHNGDRSNNYPKPEDFKNKGVVFAGADSLNNMYVDRLLCRFITKDKYDSMAGLKIKNKDILYTLRGSTIGKCAMAGFDEGTVASSLTGIRIKNENDIDAQYLLYWLMSYCEYCQRDICINGSTAPNLSAEDVAQYLLFLPVIKDQKRIVAFLDTKCAEIDSLIKSKEKLIEELTAYRKSLIYEYVTGKKEVPAV